VRAPGNCYSASIFISLASLVNDVGPELAGKRVFMFSYGSGSMASLYTIKGRQPFDSNFTLGRMTAALDLKRRLADRVPCS
jgi:hydroxymethylglutaryl-CoA synthase